MKQSDLEKLSHANFWDERYAAEKVERTPKKDESEDGTEGELGNFEWFRTFNDLRDFFGKKLPSSDFNPRILHLGCGNSVRFHFILPDWRWDGKMGGGGARGCGRDGGEHMRQR